MSVGELIVPLARLVVQLVAVIQMAVSIIVKFVIFGGTRVIMLIDNFATPHYNFIHYYTTLQLTVWRVFGTNLLVDNLIEVSCVLIGTNENLYEKWCVPMPIDLFG